MKNQLKNRLCAPLVHDTLARFCDGMLDAGCAAETLGVSRSRIYTLRSEYLQARAEGRLEGWMPGLSGGDRAPDPPPEVGIFLRGALGAGYGYAFAASEAKRLFGHDTTRSSVRRWAQTVGLAREGRPERTPAHTRRWQRENVGEVWQLDSTPHRWFGADSPPQPLLDMIDDASRLQVGIRLCRGESLADYIDFLRVSFERHGLPMSLYVDNATFFRSPRDGALTMLGRRLHFYGVSLLYASTPQAKGKIERVHQVWQDRLPPFFALNGFTAESDLADVNAAVGALADHRNANETHREIGSAPLAAWEAAVAAGRSKLRPVPADGWWPFVWSQWRNATAGDRGNIHHNGLFFPTRLRPGERAILCEHPGGHHSVIRRLPEHGAYPDILFTSLPKPAD